MGLFLVIVGALLAAAGAIMLALERFGLGRLPGDLFLQKGNVTLYAPFMTMLVVSIVLTIVINLFRR